MKELVVWQTEDAEWCAGTTSLNLEYAKTKDEVIKKWRKANPRQRVKIVEA